MPVSFKNSRSVTIVKRTPAAQLEFCDTCGGVNAMASTALKIDCTECDSTGYKNFYSSVGATAYYRPGSVKRWNSVVGALDYLGECSVKLDSRYKGLLESAAHIEFDGIQWRFTVLREPGEAMGQARLVLALSRK